MVYKRIRNDRRGFTLLELIVALSIFSVLTALISGIFLRALRMHREIVAFSGTLDVAGQSLEQMAREIRTGYGFEPNEDGESIATELRFTNARGEDVGYKLINNKIGKCINSCIAVTPEEEVEFFRPLHGEDLYIDRLMFLTGGIDPGDGFPPLIVISLRVVGPWGSLVDLQTSVSSRNIGG